MQVFGLGVHIQQAGHDLALRLALLDVIHRMQTVGRFVFGAELAQHEHRAVVLDHAAHRAGRMADLDLVARQDDVEPVHGFVVFAHIVVAARRAGVVVEGHARADDIDEGRAVMMQSAFDERNQLLFVARETAPDIGRAELQRERHEVDRAVAVDHAALALAALVGGGRKLAFGQAIHAVVLDDVGHVDAAAHRMRELPEADRGRIAIARNAEVDQIAVGERGAGQHRGHAAVHAVEAVRIAEEIIGRLRRAADARHLRDLVRFDVEIETGADDGGADRIMAAAGAQG